MFCRKCGAEISVTEKFCPMCGTEVIANQAGQAGMGESAGTAIGSDRAAGEFGAGTFGVNQTNSQMSAKKFPTLAVAAIAGGGVLLLAIIALVVSFVLPRGYEKPVSNMMKAIEKQDADLILSVFPDEFYEYLEEEYDQEYEDMEEEMEDMLDDLHDEYLGDIKIKYEIKDVSDMRNREMKDIEDAFENYFEIKDGKVIDLDMDIYVDGKREEADELELNVIKIGFKWYIDPYSTPF